jgi:hypothetical protein
VFAPFIDDYPRFLEGVEYLPVEKLIPEPGIEAFAIEPFSHGDPGTM